MSSDPAEDIGEWDDGGDEGLEDEDDDDDGTEVKDENGVLILRDSNFDTFMEDKDTVLVEFYAPWYDCTVCFKVTVSIIVKLYCEFYSIRSCE